MGFPGLTELSTDGLASTEPAVRSNPGPGYDTQGLEVGVQDVGLIPRESIHLSIYQIYIHTYIPTYLPTYLPTYIHTYIHT